MERRRNNLAVTCTPMGVLINYQTREEIEKIRRRKEFFKFGGTAELYMFSLKLKNEINSFRHEFYQTVH